MRNTSGELAYTVHFLGLLELGLHLLPFLLGHLQVMNIRAGAVPFHDVAAGVQQRHAAHQPPAVNAIRAAQAAFDRIDAVLRRRFLPGLPGPLLVIGVKWLIPPVPVAFFKRKPRIIHPALVKEDIPAVRPRYPDYLRHGLGHSVQFLYARAQYGFRLNAPGDIHTSSDPFADAPVRLKSGSTAN